MKKHLLFIFTALLPLLASAQTVEIEGIWYVLTVGTGQAEVTRNPDQTTKYTGEVTIPSTVTKDEVEYSVTSIGDYAFRDCSELTAVTIPASVTSLGSSAFMSCSGLTTIELPSGLTGKIGNYAFYGCSELTAITIPENVTSIGNSVFNGCTKLASVTLPESMESIGTYAFRDCALTSIVIPEGITSIGDQTFYGCGNLASITIPASVTSFGSKAFFNCKSLTDVYISSVEAWCNISVGHRDDTPLQYATNLYLNGTLVTELTIPGTATAVKDYAFYGVNGITSVILSEGVTSVGEFAFRDCGNLETLTLPTSVESIGNSAFNGCAKLTSITCKATTPPTCGGSNTFVFVDKSTPVYVPASAVEAYQAAEVWMDFTNIQAMPEVTVTGITLDKTTATLTEGETLALTATVAPDDATDKTVVWSTSNAEVATVDENGVVTAVAEGTATITATASGKEATCVVTVEKEQAGEDPTGIEQVEAQGSTVVYDLMGRRVEKAEKGIYIVNGRKVVIK